MSIPAHVRSRRAATGVSVLAVGTGIAATVLMVTDPTLVGGLAVQACSILTTTLVAVAAILLLTPALRGGRRLRAIILVLAVIGFVSTAVATSSWSVGFDEADAGAAPSPFAAAFLPFAITSVGVLTAAVSTVLLSIRGTSTIPLLGRLLVALPASMFVALAIAVGAALPMNAALVACALFILSLVLAARDARPTTSPATTDYEPDRLPVRDLTTSIEVLPNIVSFPFSTAAGSPAPHPAILAWAQRRATLLAWASLALTLTAWIGGLATSIVLAGQEGATEALGLTMAVGHLAAIPLVMAATSLVTARLRVRAGQLAHASNSGSSAIRALWAVAFAACGGITVTVAVLAHTDLSSGEPLYAMMPVLGLSVGIWCATASYLGGVTLPFRRPARIGAAMMIAIVSALIYAAVVAMIGGATLAVASLLLALWGAKAATNPVLFARGVVRATSPASA